MKKYQRLGCTAHEVFVGRYSYIEFDQIAHRVSDCISLMLGVKYIKVELLWLKECVKIVARNK